MKITTFILCIALFLFSCQNNNKVIDQTKAEQEEPYFKPDFHYVQQIPDSLRTPEQKELINKIQQVTAENIGAENNEMVFRLTKEEFVAKGIPEEYYELIEKDLINNNKFFKENNINVDSMIKESYKFENKPINDAVNENVSLSVAPNVFKLSKLPEILQVTMTNNTKDTITTGLYYRIESYKNNEWKEVSPKQFFNDLGYRLIPFDSRTFDEKLLNQQIDYNAGRYRIVKNYLRSDYQKSKKHFDIYAEFNIEQ